MQRLFAITTATVLFAAATHTTPAPAPNRSPDMCAPDTNYRRLDFWVGDWSVFDSTGKPYASQKVRRIVDGCAVTAEWLGPKGNKGFSVFAWDRYAHRWTQTYVANQDPFPSGVYNRVSDSTYAGPGVRFVPLGGGRTRISIVPLSNNRVSQLFEETSDSGRTWHRVFNAEHRR